MAKAEHFPIDDVRVLGEKCHRLARMFLERAVDVTRIQSYTPTQRDMSYTLYRTALLEDLIQETTGMTSAYYGTKPEIRPRILQEMRLLHGALGRIILQEDEKAPAQEAKVKY